MSHKGKAATIDNSNVIDDTFAEWDSIDTINSIRDALALYHKITLVEANQDAYNKLRELNPDIVFNFAEGASGISREAQIPAILDMLEIPYTGSDPLTLAICLNKARTKEILTYHKINTPKFFVVNTLADADNFDLTFPVVIKPIGEGSSKGIFNSSFVPSIDSLKKFIEDNLQKYDQPLIVEEFLPGREFTAAILGNEDETTVLPLVEMNFSELPENIYPIYSYEAKWIYDTSDNPLDIFTCPALIDTELEMQIKNIALKTYKALNCKDWCRIDIRLDSNNSPSIIEVNPIPGILPNPEDNSCFPKAARAHGLTYNELVNTVLDIAARRHNLV